MHLKDYKATHTPELGTICTHDLCKTRFCAVSKLPIPSSTSVPFSLSSDTVYFSGISPVTCATSYSSQKNQPMEARSTIIGRPPRTVVPNGF